jgi:hypothetical protein
MSIKKNSYDYFFLHKLLYFESKLPFFKKRGCPGWGANLGALNFIYFLIFTTLPLSHSGSPKLPFFCPFFFGENIFLIVSRRLTRQ